MLVPGDSLDIWVVEAALGQGGMGSVYRCHNRDARRILAAVKVLDPALKRSPQARARFVREAEILYSLDHPHIVKVRNVRLDADPPYLEMAFVEGQGLDHLLEAGPLATSVALPWFRQLADALAYLHGKGVRHRDVKPSNLLVGGAGITLVDFGIATTAEGNTISEAGQALGSPAYVPPEWVQVGRLDPVRWDVYAFGVSLYEALTARHAFQVADESSGRRHFYQVLQAKQGHAPLDPGPRVPWALRVLVAGATNADPDARIADAGGLLEQLAKVDEADLRDEPVVAAPPRRAPASATLIPDAWRDAGEGNPAAPPAETSPAVADLAPSSAGSPPAAPRTAREDAARSGSTAPLEHGGAPTGEAARPYRTLLVAAVVGLGVVGVGAAASLAVVVPLLRDKAAGDGSTAVQEGAGGGAPSGQSGPGTGAPVEPVVSGSAAPPAGEAAGAAAPADAPAAGSGSAPSVALSSAGPSDGPKGAASGSGSPAAEAAPPEAASPEAASPEAASPEAAPAAASAGPASAGPASAETAGPLVSQAQLAAWIARNPTWAPEAARAAGRADERYLKSWIGGEPPEGKGASPAVEVSWSLAQAYCARRGGLATIDAAPQRWTDGPTQPWMEYRQDGGRPAWRRDDGAVSLQVDPAASSLSMGFRCAR